MDDPRFKSILKDIRSKNIPKNVKKIKVDKRFRNMFNNQQFKERSQVDERGRKLDLTSAENLKKLYNVVDSSEEEEEPTTKVLKEKAGKKKEMKNSNVLKTEKNKSTHSKFLKDATVMDSRSKIDFDESGDSDEESKEEDESDVGAADEESDIGAAKEDSDFGETKEESEVGEDKDESDSSEEEDASDSDSDASNSDKKNEFDHHWEELHEEAPDTDDITKRIAVCNMDWDRIRADDLFAVFTSFKPPDSVIQSVKIYPSEYGLKRMEEEKLKGPSELVEETLDPNEEEVEDKKGSKYHREKLRQYQINRLKYYYAVVECDTPETANTLYEHLNGMEYESSSVRFDLRFIPDDLTFDQEPSSVSSKIPDPTEYKPRLFVTTALQQVKVNLTWDETDPRRRETLQKAFTDPESVEEDLKNYLASSSEESENEADNLDDGAGIKMSFKDRIAKYKELLQSLEEKDKKGEEKFEMEITWEPGLKEKTEKLVKQKLDDTSNPFDEMLKKKKEDRKLKKQNRKSKTDLDEEDKNNSESEDSDSEFFLEGNSSKNAKGQDTKKLDELYLISDSKKIVDEPKGKSSKKNKKAKKFKKAKETKLNEFQCNVLDPRFSAVYSSHEYNIDPSNPHFKKTEGTMAIIQEKQNRLKNKEPPVSGKRKSKKMKYN